GSCSVGDLLKANSTATNGLAAGLLFLFLFQRRSLRWRSSVLKLKPRLRQNSLRRMLLPTNSATNSRTSAPVRRRRTVMLPSPCIPRLHHKYCSLNRCVSRTLTYDTIDDFLEEKVRVLS